MGRTDVEIQGSSMELILFQISFKGQFVACKNSCSVMVVLVLMGWLFC